MNTLRDYYAEMGVDADTLLQINHELTVGELTLEDMIAKSTEIKREMMREAMTSTPKHNFSKEYILDSRKEYPSNIRKWPGIFIPYYNESDLVVGVKKPGKEAGIDYKLSHYKYCKCDECEGNGKKPTREGDRTPNIHDMLPVILDGDRNLAAKITYTKDSKKIHYYTPWTLDQICKPLEHLLVQKWGRFGVELFGTILFRAAFNLDHHHANGKWRMGIPHASLKLIQDILPDQKMHFSVGDEHTDFSVSSLFYFFDILGINEDIKVHAKGRVSNFMEPVTWNEHDKGKRPNKLAFNGRTNTLLTYCEMIAVMLNRSSVGDAMIGYQRGGGMYPLNVNYMGLDFGLKLFPLLSPNLSEQLDLDVTKDLGWLHSARD